MPFDLAPLDVTSLCRLRAPGKTNEVLGRFVSLYTLCLQGNKSMDRQQTSI
jgi:hypothetical protein